MEQIKDIELVTHSVTEEAFNELSCHRCGNKTPTMYANLTQTVCSCMRCLPKPEMLKAMVENNREILLDKTKEQK